MWNVMDWANYLIFFYAWYTLRRYLHEIENAPCATLCSTVGYIDEHRITYQLKQGKLYLSLCVCIQLLKIGKFTSAIVPKMGLAPLVLKRALPDLVFFGCVFIISMIAFSTLFYVQLGPVMIEYNDQLASLVSLSRALFGDFDIDLILENSSGYLNSVIFLAYLFIAVFILLSMFFAILGEAQANVRDDQRAQRKKGSIAPEYGVLTQAYELIVGTASRMPVVGHAIMRYMALAKAKELEKVVEQEGPTPVDRVEARQLEMLEAVAEISHTMAAGLRDVQMRCDGISTTLVTAAGASGGAAAVTGVQSGTTAKAEAELLTSKMGAVLAMLEAQQLQQQQMLATMATMTQQLEKNASRPARRGPRRGRDDAGATATPYAAQRQNQSEERRELMDA